MKERGKKVFILFIVLCKADTVHIELYKMAAFAIKGWYTPIFPTLGRLGQDDLELEDSLG